MASVPGLAELFPEGDYRFHLSLRRGETVDFFAPRDTTGRLLEQRRRWLLGAQAGLYAASRREGDPLLEELAAVIVNEWEIGNREFVARPSVVDLGCALEPDFALLSRDPDGIFRLQGGAVCFPSGWALAEKLGQPLESIHGVVPGLNPALAAPVQQFLSRLKPGQAYLRDNWGISATDELNLHPSRGFPSPSTPVELARLWLRVEHQALVALPVTGGILFGIRLGLHRLDEVLPDLVAARGLGRALASMPPDIAAYKGLAKVREPLAEMFSNSTDF